MGICFNGARGNLEECVRLELDKQLPLGVWIEGPNCRFFQNVEYERISSLCYICGKVGHSTSSCGAKVVNEDNVQKEANIMKGVQDLEAVPEDSVYGPWIHVNNKKRNWNIQKRVKQVNYKPDSKSNKQIFKKKDVQEIIQVAVSENSMELPNG
ncbi:hypothetical protein MA16_Dca029007 [Dendrobium catenatum]|uniref:CCHC-type domain-containing protein n=1 Tax=Dendrobium catenatum TaxID=906689 RepID=A0A2I0VCC5_9ASPA|nr:hypothetical protein MA16_Dca029007 [Dendrobium catenatum]